MKFEVAGMSRLRDVSTGYEFEWDHRDSAESAVQVSFLLPGGFVAVCTAELVDPTGLNRMASARAERQVVCSRTKLHQSMLRSIERSKKLMLNPPPELADMTPEWLDEMIPYIISGWEQILPTKGFFGPKLTIVLLDD